jgi:chaperonin GroEL (HSP60 family)
MLRQAAERTGDAVGDGTSTSALLAHALFADGVKNVVAGASGIDLKRGLDRGVKVAVEALRAQSRPVQSRLEKAQVATISAHNDPITGELVAEAMEKVGGEGVISVEESKTIKTQFEVVGQIAENSGVDGGVVVNQMRAGSGNVGFDAARKEYVDLVQAGIIDPTKVVRIALENAVSVASLLLLSEATMTEVREPKEEHVAPPLE